MGLTIEQLRELCNKGQELPKPRKHSQQKEHKMQSEQVKWFRLQYPELKAMLFAVPNADRRSARQGAYMKEEGLLAGVADLILLVGNKHYSSLCIENKIQGNYQSAAQKEWQAECEKHGNRYVVCKSLDGFIKIITDYLNDR